MVDNNLSLLQVDHIQIRESSIKSSLVEKWEKAINKKIKDLSEDDLRILINQRTGLHHIVPIALDRLEKNPFLSSGLYHGDLLVALARIPEEFWLDNQKLYARLHDLKYLIEEINTTMHDEFFPKLLWVGYDKDNSP